MIKNIKLASIYIGAIIGAGFASGREIVVFFYNASFFNLIIAAICLALIFVFFVKIPKINNVFFSVIITIAMCMSFILMVGALYELEKTIACKNLCIVLSILCCLISSQGIEKLKIINTISIVLIIIMLIFLSTKCEFLSFKKINLFNSLTYVGMNTLLGGIIVNGENKDMKNKDILVSCIIIFIVFVILFYMVYKISMNEFESAMPIVSFAKKVNYLKISSLIVALAIVTTLLASGHIIFQNLSRHIDKKISGMFLVILAFVSYKMPYYELSKTMYPILGYMGCTYILISIFLILKKEFSLNNFTYSFNRKIHYSGHDAKQNCRGHNKV